MFKFTHFLVIMATGCLLLAACSEKKSVSTQEVNVKSANPPVGSNAETQAVVTPAASEKSISPTVGNTGEKAVGVTPDTNEKLATPTNGTYEDKILVITPSIKGQSVSLHLGETFEVQIPTIPTDGFEWEPQNLDPSILVEVGKPVYTADSSPNAAGGIVTLTFKSVGAGKTTLTLLYLRPAVNGVASLYKNSFGVTIEVK
jgi:predicted secreted protein